MTAAQLAAAIKTAVAERGGLTGHFGHCDTKLGMGRPCSCGWERIRVMIARYKELEKKR